MISKKTLREREKDIRQIAKRCNKFFKKQKEVIVENEKNDN